MTTKLCLDHYIATFQEELTCEQEAGRVNGMEALVNSQRRRAAMDQSWQAIQQILQPLQQALEELPALPDRGQMRWAQGALSMSNLAFMEVDTTGLETEDDLVRFTLLDGQGQVLEDLLIQPVQRSLSCKSSHFSGITAEQMALQGIPLDTAWTRLQRAVKGRYLLSYGRDWDLQMLDSVARRSHLEPLILIGDDLQRHATRYYQREYYLSLGELCERVGSPLPANPNQTSIHRAHGQLSVLTALASAVTDVRTKKPTSLPIEEISDLDEPEDEHPF